jgi:aryl-alcohol dehydrogenase-like predicted oxidoreductase
MHSAVGSQVRAAGRFSVGAAQASLDQSLAALATDYLDILFLHDCGPDDLTDELTAFLDAQVAAGKIRAYGVATSIAAVTALSRRRGDKLLCQFANSVCVRNAETLPRGTRRFIAHSPFSGADRVGIAKPHRLMLGWALAQDNVAVVLSSMLDEAHLRTNLDVAERPDLTDSDLAALEAAVR